jgi:hypothetical protein
MRCVASIFCLLFLPATLLFADEILNPELIPGIHLMNNGQLLESQAFYKSYVQLHPDDPKALFLLTMINWKIMWISSYSQTEREDLGKLIDQVDQSFLAKKDTDADALFFYTASIGLRASIATWENEWWDAAQLGKKMKKNAEDLVRINPENYDSDYLLGSYNYFADVLPGGVKLLRSLLFLPSGNKVDGVKQLILAYQKGKITAGEAGRTLSIIYTYFEKQHDYGVKMCNNVLAQYPDNYEVGLYKGINLYFRKDWQDSQDWLQKVRTQVSAYSSKHEQDVVEKRTAGEIVPVYAPLDREVRYWISRNLIQMERYEDARVILESLAEPEIHKPYWIQRGVFLSLAEIELEEDHPDKAEADIDRVLKWPDVKDSHAKAKLLKEKKKKTSTFDLDFL